MNRRLPGDSRSAQYWSTSLFGVTFSSSEWFSDIVGLYHSARRASTPYPILGPPPNSSSINRPEHSCYSSHQQLTADPSPSPPQPGTRGCRRLLPSLITKHMLLPVTLPRANQGFMFHATR